MPDWLSDDLDQDQVSEPEQPRKVRRRRRLGAARTDQQDRNRQRALEIRQGTSPLAYLVTALVLLVVLVAAAYGLPRLLGRSVGQPDRAVLAHPASTPTRTAAASTPEAGEPTTPSGPTRQQSPTATSATSAEPLDHPGDGLSKAFLAAFLTRTDPASDDWRVAAAPYATDQLIKTLGRQGPSYIGFDGWPAWKPTKYRKIKLPDQPVDTDTRVTASWVVTVSDGAQRSQEQPFQLTQYLGADNTWRVSTVTLPYTSEG